jgi:hypothetical protein
MNSIPGLQQLADRVEKGVAPVRDQNLFAPTHVEQQITNVLVTLHGLGVEDAADWRLGLEGEGESPPTLHRPLFVSQEHERSCLFETLCFPYQCTVFYGLLDQPFDVVAGDLLSWSFQDGV